MYCFNVRLRFACVPVRARDVAQIRSAFKSQDRVPCISRLMVDNEDTVLDHARTIVIGNPGPDFWNVLNQLQWSIHRWRRSDDRSHE
jgi:hypothetical protein